MASVAASYDTDRMERSDDGAGRPVEAVEGVVAADHMAARLLAQAKAFPAVMSTFGLTSGNARC